MIFFSVLSRLPFRILYYLADVLCFVLAHVVRYRRSVIRLNLTRSFPEKTPAQIRALVRGYYRNLTDMIVETIKLPALSADELRQRVVYRSAEPIRQFLASGQSVLIMASHQANWEWLPASTVLNGMAADSIYKPLENPFFERLMRTIRATFGANPVPTNRLLRDMASRRHEPRLIALVADQMPDTPEHGYWTTFMHQDTPFYPGSERLARSLNLPVYYIEMVRLRRGHYEATFIRVAEPPYTSLSAGTILERYRDLLEKTIIAHPSDWLWSHKRWKHRREKYAKIETKLE
ncbi:MAG: lysophospholipid acyltransferase family protein [Bacteroidetes bacterium]|nr:lysophospholipid acyltransferase family protein [Fibrella sp.]